MRRMLCIWFPNWTIQRWRQAEPATRSAALVVLAEARGRGLRVSACCERAARQGVVPGLPAAEARALFPDSPIWKQADPTADFEAMQQLACDCQTYSPLTGLEASDAESLLIDITGCAHLFGGERTLLQELTRQLIGRGYRVRTAIADTIGAAWGIAHDGPAAHTIVPPGETAAALQTLPVAALRLSPKVLERLDRLDLRTLEQLQNLPQQTLDSRFGPELLRRLNQALGKVWESFTPERLTKPLTATWSEEEPLTTQPAVVYVFRRLLERLLAELAPRRAGLVELACEFQAAAGPSTISLRLSGPSTNLKHLTQLFELHGERQVLPGEILAVRLEAVRLGSLEERQATLFEADPQASDREIDALVERLSSRLGEQAVLRPVPVDDPLPELSVRYLPWLEAAPATEVMPDRERAGSAPWRLLAAPEPVEVLAAVPNGPPSRLFWQGQTWNVHQSWGPDRLETGWWRNRDTKRDYYRVETDPGQQFWLFRRRDTGRWFLHGFFE